MYSRSCTFNAPDEAGTARFGAVLAEILPAGTVVALVGPLGAGKTRLVQAIATALGVPRDAVSSPTFVLVHEYRHGQLPLFHFDAYRLKDVDEFVELGPDEYFESNGICLIEWADRVEEFLPGERLEITIEVLGEHERRFTLTGRGEAQEAVCRAISLRLASGEPNANS